MANEMRTGIKALDKMLGAGIPTGSLVLLRGGPGSGKTTLALQIVANHLREDNEDNKALGVFVSLEKDPEIVLKHVDDTYRLGLGGNPNLLLLTREDLEKGCLLHPDLPFSYNFGWFLGTFLDKKLSASSQDRRVLVVIDSLNVLVDLVLQVFDAKTTTKKSAKAPPGDPKIPLKRRPTEFRAVLENIASTMQYFFAGKIVLFTGEYDPQDSKAASALSESFFCDTVIQLATETVSGQRTPRFGSLAREAKPGALSLDRRSAGEPETRFFCRVLKHRSGPRQARRCAYDIVSHGGPKKGVAFYETYPGDGQIVLFAENPAQQEAWDVFFERDIPQMYPALRTDSFGRLGLQRIFASQRRFRSIPMRTDMYLSSIDTYWVNWYVELCQRWELADRFRKVLSRNEPSGEKLPCVEPDAAEEKKTSCAKPNASEELQRRFPRIICLIHRNFRQTVAKCTGEPPLKVPSGCAAAIRKGVAKVCKGCEEKLSEMCLPRIEQEVGKAWEGFCKEEQQCGLLRPIAWKDLRLFGERRSNIIEELEKFVSEEENRPVFRPWPKPREKIGWTGKVLAVPYDANIGFFVCRLDVLKKVKGGVQQDELFREILAAHVYVHEATEVFERLQTIATEYKDPPREEVSDVSELSAQEAPLGQPNAQEPLGFVEWIVDTYANRYSDAPTFEPTKAVIDTATRLAADLMQDNALPQTFEEVFALCKLGKCHFLIETQTFDTFLCTLLEFLWNCGGDMRIAADYSFSHSSDDEKKAEDRKETGLRLMQAMTYLDMMFRHGIIPRNCTLEAKEFAKRYPGKGTGPDWLFARHWYSTYVDNLLTKEEGDKKSAAEKKKIYAWEPKGIRLDVMQIPMSLSRYAEMGAEKHYHISCWGEWYLGVMSGTENEALAVDLINNVMSSQKVADRAFAHASVPTVEEFYQMYGDTQCLNIPERSDVKQPDLTFSGLRKKFFDRAKSRTQMFDYRHCMRELHGVLEYVHVSGGVSPKDLAGRILYAMRRIEALRDQEVLVSP
ncbi:MAG TPA: ATPase domain-containing protein [Phycisphaerae bacterium]|nr:ATPase domain-containing protein [Phycisphaerae bacterium]